MFSERNRKGTSLWKSDETTEQLLASLEHKDWYREKLAVLYEKRKHKWLSVRVLLKALCGEEKEIAYCSSGRPYLKDGSRYISISHTRGYVGFQSIRQVSLKIFGAGRSSPTTAISS